MNTGTRKEILLLPFWIYNSLQRSKLTADKVLDLSSIYDLMSREDLASVICLNETFSRNVFGCDVSCTGVYKWLNDSELFYKLKELTPLVDPTIYPRLFSQESFDAIHDKAFLIKDIDSSIFLVVIFPGYFGGLEAEKHQHNLRRELLKLCYVYHGYESAAKEDFYEKYLDGLATH